MLYTIRFYCNNYKVKIPSFDKVLFIGSCQISLQKRSKLGFEFLVISNNKF